MKRLVLLVIVGAAIAAAIAGLQQRGAPQQVDDPDAPRVLVNRDKNNIALQGYDPVAYFTDGRPVKGDPGHRATFQGAEYHFASARHKEMFEAEPER